MKTEWRGEIVEIEDKKCMPSRIKEGDFIPSATGELMEVITIQRDCPRLENLSARFTMFTLQSRDGTIVPERALFGEQVVFKRKYKVVYVK